MPAPAPEAKNPPEGGFCVLVERVKLPAVGVYGGDHRLCLLPFEDVQQHADVGTDFAIDVAEQFRVVANHDGVADHVSTTPRDGDRRYDG